MRHALAVVAAIVLAGCLTESPAVPELTQETAEPLRFLAIGDMGTGDENQARVADGMEAVCLDLGCDLVIGMGDNIYEVGVTSPYDPQFEVKFELPYQDLDAPFYMTLGNHDNGGVRGAHALGDLQIAYSEREDRLSDKWHMPARWYEHTHGDVRFIALDTNINWYNNSGASGETGVDLLSADPNAEAETAFIESVLAQPWDGWTIMHGHHPLYSNGDHGDTGMPTGWWLEYVTCRLGDVDVSFSGHDHDLQWIKAKPDTCGDTEFIISGAAAKTRPLPRDNHDAWFGVGDTLGFFWVEIHGDTFTGKAFDADGGLLFERSFTRA